MQPPGSGRAEEEETEADFYSGTRNRAITSAVVRNDHSDPQSLRSIVAAMHARNEAIALPSHGNFSQPSSSIFDSLLSSQRMQAEQRRQALLLASIPQAMPRLPPSMTLNGYNPLLNQPSAMDILAAEQIQRRHNLLFGSSMGRTTDSEDIQRLLELRRLSSILPGSHDASSFASPDLATLSAALAARDSLSSVVASSNQPVEESSFQAAAPSRSGSPTSRIEFHLRINNARVHDFNLDPEILKSIEQSTDKGRVGTFPQKLYQALSSIEESDEGRDIAGWQAHGHSFYIKKPEEFVNEIMSKFVRLKRFSSFQRQLNLYDFRKMSHGPDRGSYYHMLFHRGCPKLASQIRRNKGKGEDNSNWSGVKDQPTSLS